MRRWREQLINQRTQGKNRLDKGQSAGARASAERHIAWLVDGITRPNKESQALLNDWPAVAGRAVLYRSAPGIGVLTAATPMAELPELGRADSRSLAGVEPWDRDSGQQGKRSIRGDRGAARRILYLVALSASRYHSGLREFYQRLLALGKVGKVRWWQ